MSKNSRKRCLKIARTEVMEYTPKQGASGMIIINNYRLVERGGFSFRGKQWRMLLPVMWRAVVTTMLAFTKTGRHRRKKDHIINQAHALSSMQAHTPRIAGPYRAIQTALCGNDWNDYERRSCQRPLRRPDDKTDSYVVVGSTTVFYKYFKISFSQV